MKLLVFGASGRTGSMVVAEAQRAGHEVTAFLHEAKDFGAGVKTAVGDAADRAAVERALAGQEAVVDTIGGATPYKDTGLETSTARVIVDAMQSQDVKRLVVVSAMGVGDSTEQTPFWYEYLLMPTMLRGVVKDKTRMEQEVRASALDFVIVRPALLSDDDAEASLRVVSGDAKGHRTARGDLARFVVAQLTSDEHLGQAVVVANS